jgi:BED zinc finger
MFFTQLSGQFKAKCDTCGNEYSFTGGSTSNLALHIRNKHPSLADMLPSRKSKLRAKSVVGASASVGPHINDDVIGSITAD